MEDLRVRCKSKTTTHHPLPSLNVRLSQLRHIVRGIVLDRCMLLNCHKIQKSTKVPEGVVPERGGRGHGGGRDVIAQHAARRAA